MDQATHIQETKSQTTPESIAPSIPTTHPSLQTKEHALSLISPTLGYGPLNDDSFVYPACEIVYSYRLDRTTSRSTWDPLNLNATTAADDNPDPSSASSSPTPTLPKDLLRTHLRPTHQGK